MRSQRPVVQLSGRNSKGTEVKTNHWLFFTFPPKYSIKYSAYQFWNHNYSELAQLIMYCSFVKARVDNEKRSAFVFLQFWSGVLLRQSRFVWPVWRLQFQKLCLYVATFLTAELMDGQQTRGVDSWMVNVMSTFACCPGAHSASLKPATSGGGGGRKGEATCSVLCLMAFIGSWLLPST